MIQAINLKVKYPSAFYRAAIIPERNDYEVLCFQVKQGISFFRIREKFHGLEDAAGWAMDYLRDNTEEAEYEMSLDIMYPDFTISAMFEFMVEGNESGWMTTLHLHDGKQGVEVEHNLLSPLRMALWWAIRMSMDVAEMKRKEG